MLPLTIKHKKEDLPLFNMAKASLLSLISFESEKQYKRMKKLRKDRIKNRKCKCVNNPLIEEGRIVLTCKHMKNEWEKDKIVQECNKKIEKMTSVLILRNVYTKFEMAGLV